LGVGQAAEAIDVALTAIAEALAAGETVTLPGFGVFERRARAARTGRNPQTGEALEIAATLVPAFKPAAGLKRLVAQSTSP
jgi:DNA-binding protein HU-beta